MRHISVVPRFIKNAVGWLWTKFWAWGPLGWIVGTICVSVGLLLAPERMYETGRVLVAFGGILVSVKVIHDAVAENRPIKEILAVSAISVAIFTAVVFGGLWIIGNIEWNHEVVINMTFKSSALLTEKRQRDIVWEVNEYYLYLKKIGFSFPVEIPPLGLSPKHGPIMGGGGDGPAYYSSLIVSEDSIDSPDILRYIYSAYSINRILVWPDSRKLGISRAEAEDDEESAWIFSCYFPQSFSGHKVCADDSPGHSWKDAMLEVRSKYGQEYADELMSYTAIMS